LKKNKKKGNNVKRINNIYKKIYDFENLYLAYLSARKGKKYRQDVLQFSAHLEENLIQIQNELIWKTYKVGKYRQFYIHEPKKRLIMALPFKDRVVQWAIYRQINPIIDKQFIYDSYGSRKGKGAFAASNRLQKWVRHNTTNKDKEYDFYLKLDISKYFYRVDHEVLINDAKRRIKDNDMIWLLSEIINNKKIAFGLPPNIDPEDCQLSDRLFDVGMPIGNLTSQLEANMYLDNLDQFAKHSLHLKKYIRYMDDIIILGKSKTELWEVKNRIERFVNNELKLNLNNKTRVGRSKNGIEFIGLRIFPYKRKIKRQTINRMKSRLKYMRKAYKDSRKTKEELEATESSYRALLKCSNAYGLIKKFNL